MRVSARSLGSGRTTWQKRLSRHAATAGVETSVGVLECWSDGMMGHDNGPPPSLRLPLHHSTTPLYSSTPLHSVQSGSILALPSHTCDGTIVSLTMDASPC